MTLKLSWGLNTYMFSFLSRLGISSLLAMKIAIVVLIVCMGLIAVSVFCPALTQRYVTVLKGFLLRVLSAGKKHGTLIYHRVVDWVRSFQSAPPEVRWKMVRIPVFIGIAAIILLTVGPLFIPPKILTTFPGNQGKDTPLDSKIEFIFDKGVVQPLAEKSFSISPQIPGTFSWESDQKLVFTPASALERGKEYTVHLRGPVLSKFLVPLLGFPKISFETIGDPSVVVASPQQEALEDFTPVTVVFDRQMIPLTTATNSALKKPAFVITPEIAGEGSWLGTTAYQFRPTDQLRKGTTYTVTVAAGMASQDGGILKSDYSWQFSSQRPHVDLVSPLHNYSYASPVASVAAIFNQQINTKTVADKLVVFDSNNNKVEGRIVVKGHIVGFYSSQPLARQAVYKAVVYSGIQGVEGPNGLEDDYSWSFTTAARPEVIRTTPTNGSKEVGEQYNIQAIFKTPMNNDSFEGNVTIDPAPSVDPSTYFSTYENRLSIGTYLARSKQYKITIGANVKDQYGVPLGTPYTFSFSTAPYKPSLSIHPAGTYFGAFNQQVTQRVVAQIINTRRIDYAVYKLQKDDLLDLYRRRYTQQCGNDSSCRNWQSYDTSKLTKVKTWSQEFEAESDTPTQVVTKVTQPDGNNLPSGFYFLQLSIPEGPHDNMVMIVSKSTVTVKQSDAQILTWSVDQSTGDVIPNMNMQLLESNGTVLSSGTSNADGVFIKDVNLFRKDNLLVYGQRGDDVVVAANAWGEGINRYDFGLPTYYSANEQKDYDTQQSFKTFLVLDRPIYRPGHKVYFKGVIRKDTDGAYASLPAGEKVSVTIQDAMNRPVYSEGLPITTFGSFAGEFVLGTSANLGYYQIQSTYQGNSATQSFQVEEYKKPDLAVAVNPSKTDYVHGETADIALSASYYFGAPVSDTNMSYVVNMRDYSFQWKKNWRFEFGDPDTYWGRPWWYYSGLGFDSQKLVKEGKGTTDSQGNLLIHLPIDISKQSGSQQMVIEATVNDLNNQVIAASQTITVHKAAIYAGVHPTDYGNQSGNPATVEVVTVDDKGIEVPSTDVVLSFYKRTWETVREQNPDDGNFYYTSKPSDTLITTQTITTDGQGYGKAAFTPTEGGVYKVVSTVTDSSGNKNSSGTFLWVSGYGFRAPRTNNDRIVLTTDKPDYLVGDTLSVFVASPFASSSAKTLLTAERATVLDYKVVDTSETSNNFKMAIPSSFTPNAFIGAVLVKPGTSVTNPAEFKVGYTPVTVTDQKQQLVVTITTDGKKYKPRDTMQATIETKDARGRPVAAEVAVGLVDKAVWDLAEVELPDIYKVFYQPRNLGVSTAQLLTMSIDRINANLNLGAKGGSGGGCFTGDTQILMAGGIHKSIQDLQVGDTILTKMSDTSSKLVSTKVLQTFKHEVDRYLIINGTLKVTPVHKIFVNGKWTVAGTITPGDYLLDKNNSRVRVFSVEQVMGKFTVYNLETETYHTYMAGDFYVHNDKGGFETARSNFPDTAYWNPYVKTDANGKAQVTIPLPDSLTTWRLAAIANSSEAAFGQNTAEVIVGRDVVIRPFLPRFLAVGDQAKLGAIVMNTSGKDQTITAKIETQGITISENTTQKRDLPDGKEAKIVWSTEAQGTSSASIKLSVLGDNSAILDSMIMTIPVKSYSVPEVVATAGQAKDTAKETIVLPKDVDQTQGMAMLSYSPSLGSGSIDGLPYLFEYPYSCIEQITSRFLPSLYVNRILKQSNNTSIGTISQSYVQHVITDAVQTLNNRQHPDGGWGWFVEYDSDPFVTAYALSALKEAKKDGFTVPDQTISKAGDYLLRQLAYSGSSVNLDIQAYIVSVLSDTHKNASSYASTLYARRFELSLEGRAYLAMAMNNFSGMGTNAHRVFNELSGMAKLTATTAHWEESKKNYYLLGSNTSLTAAMIDAFLVFDKRSPLIPQIIRYLMTTRTDNHWGSTRDTAAVIAAISRQLLSSNDQGLDLHYKVSLNDEELQTGSLKKEDLLKILHTNIPIRQLPVEKTNTLTISKSGTGNVYYNLNLKYYLPFSTINALDQGFVIVRKFVDSKGKEVSKDQIAENSEAWVRLIVVAPAERRYVTVEDVLPAGLEAVNESLKNVSVLNKQRPPKENKNNYSYYFDHIEYHDDRTSLFARYLPAGVYEFTYRVRATTPGRYHYPPAQIFESYTPDVSGHSEGGWFEVK